MKVMCYLMISFMFNLLCMLLVRFTAPLNLYSGKIFLIAKRYK